MIEMHVQVPTHGRQCKCSVCRAARTSRERARRMGLLPPAVVSTERALAWLHHLRAEGMGVPSIAKRSGVHHRTISYIISGHLTRIRTVTEERLLATQVRRADQAVVSSFQTKRLLRRLLSEGYTRKMLKERLDRDSLRFGERVRVRTERQVVALYQQLTR